MQRLWDLLEQQPGTEVTVDLESRTVRAGEGPDAIEDSFDIDDYTRWRLLEGLDDVSITLSHDADIEAFEATRPSYRPRTTGLIGPETGENPSKQGKTSLPRSVVIVATPTNA